MNSCALVLASASPRRLHLLSSLGLQLDVSPVDIDETPGAGEDPAALALRLAEAKAAVAAARHPGRVVLAADTVVALGADTLGKPADAVEANRMLQRLSGVRHEVFTAVAARRDRQAGSRLSRSEVDFRVLAPEEIETYVGTGEPLDKAGAYGIQGVAAVFISRLCGSYSGVVGIPLHDTAELLRDFGIDVLRCAGGGR
ncbi:nucleoside triphosphate pyrophosphatase [Thioalkalivibrio sp. XN279]|uniref:Maf family protein n=1 Tax=Thioalkalivibrio sp. XN279 TaxID=2714953 RepID=UPI0014090892|nr:Maf family protein [Thioalkalivibrio sp. XN279]NHA15171.1 septum formation inhibitor Maf [Thioalkalivibrio sp. XN279]